MEGKAEIEVSTKTDAETGKKLWNNKWTEIYSRCFIIKSERVSGTVVYGNAA